jgi:hypothetical protein
LGPIKSIYLGPIQGPFLFEGTTMLQKVISRKEAKALGLKRYHGKTCPKHGFVERYTCSTKCVVCRRERDGTRESAESLR